MTAIAEALRASDPERHFAALFAPADRRDDLMALSAYGGELARVADRVSGPATGEIRLTWWREIIEGRRDGEAAANPVAAGVLAAMARRRLPRPVLAAMAEARRVDLYDDAMPGISALEGHFGESESAPLQLAALILDPALAPESAEAAGHGGCVIGAAILLARFPLIAPRGAPPLPSALLGGADRNALAGAGGAAAVEAIAGFAAAHYRGFLAAPPPPSLRPAFLPVAAAARQIGRALARPQIVARAGLAPAPVATRFAMLRAATGRWPAALT